MLHIDAETAESWPDEVVIERWMQLFSYKGKGNMLIYHYLRGEITTKAELNVVADIIASWRSRLMDISWFMRCLNESIAREANKEDNCKGRFWSLSHVRMLRDTSIDNTLEESDFTSIQDRLFAYSEQRKNIKTKNNSSSDKEEAICGLLSFKGGE